MINRMLFIISKAVTLFSPMLKPIPFSVSIVLSRTPKIERAAITHITREKKFRIAAFPMNCTTIRMIIHAHRSFRIPWAMLVSMPMPSASLRAMARLALKIMSAVSGHMSFMVLLAMRRSVGLRFMVSSFAFTFFLKMG